MAHFHILQGCTIEGASSEYFDKVLSDNMADYPDGIVIPIDKPYHWTSADVVRKIKFQIQKHFKQRNLKVGHAGTLDPLATGLLLVCIGKATKRAEELQAHPKEYIATVEFGATTPSYDLEKEIDALYPDDHITEDLVKKVLPSFLGEQEQIPPLFSAKVINGIRAYEYARAGESPEMKKAIINIFEIELISFRKKESDCRPSATIRIKCSKGTYIRSLARDLGVALESGGHLTALRRISSGDFKL